jgi:hypothetical protein
VIQSHVGATRPTIYISSQFVCNRAATTIKTKTVCRRALAGSADSAIRRPSPFAGLQHVGTLRAGLRRSFDSIDGLRVAETCQEDFKGKVFAHVWLFNINRRSIILVDGSCRALK